MYFFTVFICHSLFQLDVDLYIKTNVLLIASFSYSNFFSLEFCYQHPYEEICIVATKTVKHDGGVLCELYPSKTMCNDSAVTVILIFHAKLTLCCFIVLSK